MEEGKCEAKTVEKLKDEVLEEIDDQSDLIRKVSKKIHQNPELGFEEHKAQQLLSEALDNAGFEVAQGIANLETTIRAFHPKISAGPTIAILGEYDALPDLGHACGHNLIAGGALGACLGLSSLKQDIPGRLEFIGTPAEETRGGKVLMANAGVFDDVDIAMMFHPSSKTIAYSRRAASLEVKLSFKGKSAHAAASPEKGIDPLTAVIQTFVCIDSLRQHNPEDTRIHGVITEGGNRPNMFPETATARFTIRGATNEKRDKLVENLRSCGSSAAKSTGATLSFEKVNQGFQALRPNRKLADVFADNLEELGEDVQEGHLGMGSTDMGNISQICPSIHPYISISDEEIVGHSPEFAEAASSERGFEAMLTASKALAMTAIEVAVNKSLFQEINA